MDVTVWQAIRNWVFRTGGVDIGKPSLKELTLTLPMIVERQTQLGVGDYRPRTRQNNGCKTKR